jgi:hypothetical protein
LLNQRRRGSMISIKTPWLPAVIAAGVVLSTPLRSAASCWASNPAGTRQCAWFMNRYGGIELLCEDKPGDCGSLGYAQIPKPLEEIPGLLEERRPVTSSRPYTAARRRTRAVAEPKPTAEALGGAEERQKHPSYSMSPFSQVQMLIALTLSALLFVTGLVLLPPEHRFRVYRVGTALSFILLVALAALLSFATPGNSRRRPQGRRW